VASLFSTLSSAAGALDTIERVLAVTQNNVANASTPGYVEQVQTLQALPFNPAVGLGGGVTTGEIQSQRNQYADQSVRQQTTLLGYAQQNVDSLTSLQDVFDISGSTGIPAALTSLYNSFSAWAQSPSDGEAQQAVLQQAAGLAQAFSQTAAGINQVEQDTEQQVSQTVDTVNQIVGQLQVFNTRVMAGGSNDAGLDAQIHSTLEQLSQYVSFSILNNQDGTVSVLLNGQTPLLVEDHQYQIAQTMTTPTSPPPTYSSGRPPIQILASDGSDITPEVTGGQLGALLNLRNSLLPSYLGDSYQQGSLNQMAQQFADRVNQQLISGESSEGPPAVQGVALFTYDTTNLTNAAATLAVNPDITASQLAAIAPGPPVVANGVALALSGLENPQSSADEIQGESFSEFYGTMAAQTGQALNNANDQLQLQQSSVAQAKNLQQQLSGVSLDQEAATLIQFQSAYDANARLITVLDQLTQDTINLLPAS
jgi:flagellar hook-associated protein 1 FlgK